MVLKQLFSNCIQILGEMRLSGWTFLANSWALVSLEGAASHRDQPLSRIAIDRAVVAPEDRAFVKASPSILGLGVSFQRPLTDFR